MIKGFFVACSVILLLGKSTLVSAQPVEVVASWADTQPNKHMILYDPNSLLTIKDFMGRASIGHRAQALTKSSMGYSSSMVPVNGVYVLQVKVNALFDKQGSWFKHSHADDYVLAHEQLHFDLTGYYALLMLHAIRQYPFTRTNYRAAINKIYDQFSTRLQQDQQRYDSETRHGTLEDKQAQWSKRIVAMLETLPEV